MINITFRPDTLELEIEGHANHDMKGKDIVCSAVSCLFYTLDETLRQSIVALKKTTDFKDDDGHGYIRSYPKKGSEGFVKLLYFPILVGLQMLSEQYPDNVSYKVEGE